jgi:hypothetical protein
METQPSDRHVAKAANSAVAGQRDNQCVFERPSPSATPPASSTGTIDLYKRGSFVLEAKQGSETPNHRSSPTLPAAAAQPATCRAIR